jgi:hypothetical protein
VVRAFDANGMPIESDSEGAEHLPGVGHRSNGGGEAWPMPSPCSPGDPSSAAASAQGPGQCNVDTFRRIGEPVSQQPWLRGSSRLPPARPVAESDRPHTEKLSADPAVQPKETFITRNGEVS